MKNKPIRILQVIGSLNVGGSQTMLLNLYKHIDRAQIQFDFIIDHPNEIYFKKEVEALGAKVYVMPSFKLFNYFAIKKVWQAFFLEHKNEYKIIHSHVRSYASIFLRIAKINGLKTIIHCHSTSNGKGPASLVKKLLQLPLRHICDFFIACSLKAGLWLFGKRITRNANFYILKNAIDLELFKFNKELRKEYRDLLGIGADDIVFIHVGRFHKAKNHCFLIDAFNQYHTKKKNSKLILAGDGDLRSEIEKQIRMAKLGDSVILLGNRNDVPNLLNASDCFLLPSKWEGLPVTAVEAQAAGLRCLISDKITNEICVSKLVVTLPIDKGPSIWANYMLNQSFERKDCIFEISQSGYDINQTSRWLLDFYLNILKAI